MRKFNNRIQINEEISMYAEKIEYNKEYNYLALYRNNYLVGYIYLDKYKLKFNRKEVDTFNALVKSYYLEEKGV